MLRRATPHRTHERMALELGRPRRQLRILVGASSSSRMLVAGASGVWICSYAGSCIRPALAIGQVGFKRADH